MKGREFFAMLGYIPGWMNCGKCSLSCSSHQLSLFSLQPSVGIFFTLVKNGELEDWECLLLTAFLSSFSSKTMSFPASKDFHMLLPLSGTLSLYPLPGQLFVTLQILLLKSYILKETFSDIQRRSGLLSIIQSILVFPFVALI